MSGKRRDALKALFTPAEPEAGATSPMDAAPGAAPPRRQRAGAVKAMGLSLAGMREAIEAQGGDRVVEISPALIDAAFVTDRLSEEESGDPGFAALVESVRANGQQVPVLLRPHPEVDGRYQTAYGHRRVRAAARLGRPVQAVVRSLSDDELVVAQGKENAERRDLSFIERALFAAGLVERGFGRGLVQEALVVHKSELARLLAVAAAVPRPLARAIGPAPKAGRPRWLALAACLKQKGAETVAADVIGSEAFASADSDRRFRMLLDRLSRKQDGARPEAVCSAGGTPLARLSTGAGKPRLEFIGKEGAAFARFVADEMEALVRRFEASRTGQD